MTNNFDSFEIGVGEFTFDAIACGPEEGQPVILLHGFPQTYVAWRHVMPLLGEAGFRVIAYNQRGYSKGARPLDTESYSTDKLALDVIEIANKLSFDTFQLVGHDWGGAVAWLVASMYPERLQSLTSVSTPHPLAFGEAYMSSDSDQSTKSTYMQFFQQEKIPEEVLLSNNGSGLRMLFTASGLDDNDPEIKDDIDQYISLLMEPFAMTAALNWYRAMMHSESILGLKPITVPTLYVWSTEDIALGRQAAEATGKFVSSEYKFVILEGISHWIPEQNANRLGQLLVEHFKKYGK